VGADITGRQPCGVEADNLVVHPVDPGLALLNQLRLKTAVTVARHFNGQSTIVALQRLACCAVTAIGLFGRWLSIRLIAKVIGQLRAQHSLHQADLQFLH